MERTKPTIYLALAFAIIAFNVFVLARMASGLIYAGFTAAHVITGFVITTGLSACFGGIATGMSAKESPLRFVLGIASTVMNCGFLVWTFIEIL